MNLVDFARILQVIFGIGLVIFVHEAGHFIAARMCGVRADVFSLGFGPRMFGFKRGGTLYQVAWLPLGGYVKMAGEFPDASRTPAPDELQGKSVGQRFFIYSGGVIMNVIFALLVFPLVLSSGVPVLRPIIAAPAQGTPAWHAGLPAGTEILAVDGDEVYDFFHIPNEVALSSAGPIDFAVRYPGSATTEHLSITPVYSSRGGFRQIGVGPGVDPQHILRVVEESAASAAGLRSGDQLLAVLDTPDGLSLVRQLDWSLRDGRAVTLRVLRNAEELQIHVDPSVESTEDRFFGIEPLSNLIKDLRPSPWINRLGLVKGARLLQIDGHTILNSADLGDALRDRSSSGPLLVLLQPADSALPPIQVECPSRPTDLEVVAIERDVFLGYDPNSALASAMDEGAALAAGLQIGDQIRSVDGKSVSTWQEVLKITRDRAEEEGATQFTLDRRDAAGVTQAVTLAIQPALQQRPQYGIGLEGASGIYQTESFMGSIRAGTEASWRFLTDSWLTLKKMFLREVSTENLGGVITIGAVSYDWAAQGWAKLFFFLCMLSINLAFINVLPIPVLDGGHLAFCIVEAIKGSPVSERTLGYSQVVGLVVILTLTIYVTYQDILRFLPTGN